MPIEIHNIFLFPKKTIYSERINTIALKCRQPLSECEEIHFQPRKAGANIIKLREGPVVILPCLAYSAAAPEMISMSSPVMTACLVLLYVSASLSIISPAMSMCSYLKDCKNKIRVQVSTYRRSCWSCPWQSSWQTVLSMRPPSWRSRSWRRGSTRGTTAARRSRSSRTGSASPPR